METVWEKYYTTLANPPPPLLPKRERDKFKQHIFTKFIVAACELEMLSYNTCNSCTEYTLTDILVIENQLILFYSRRKINNDRGTY